MSVRPPHANTTCMKGTSVPVPSIMNELTDEWHARHEEMGKLSVKIFALNGLRLAIGTSTL